MLNVSADFLQLPGSVDCFEKLGQFLKFSEFCLMLRYRLRQFFVFSLVDYNFRPMSA